ncbi:MAG TPA: DUF5996 family protein [Alphaproteobacteria bacterium]|jgi:hypothetical protein
MPDIDPDRAHADALLDEALDESFPASDPVAVHPAAPAHKAWPALPYAAWQDTCETLHLWTQVVGKVRLARTPWLNHSWHVPLYVSARGLSTSPIPDGERSFEMEFDFIDHKLAITVSSGERAAVELKPQTVAAFHAAVMAKLRELGIDVQISDFPCEIPGAIPFSRDEAHTAYDAEAAQHFWHALVQADRVLRKFRTAYLGKSSPVHFFWGSFDLAVTRFSGRRAPQHPGGVPGLADAVVCEAYSHEVSSAGFWPGGNGVDAAFYAYAYPEPEGFKAARVHPEAAFYSEALHEFLLPYETVRTAQDPEATLLAFLQSSYEAAAEAAEWDRAALECGVGREAVPRPVG